MLGDSQLSYDKIILDFAIEWAGNGSPFGNELTLSYRTLVIPKDVIGMLWFWAIKQLSRQQTMGFFATTISYYFSFCFSDP